MGRDGSQWCGRLQPGSLLLACSHGGGVCAGGSWGCQILERVGVDKGPGHSHRGSSVLHGWGLLISPLPLDPDSPSCCGVPSLIGHFAYLA